MLEFVVIFAKLLLTALCVREEGAEGCPGYLQMRYPVLKKDDALGGTFGTLNEETLDMLKGMLGRVGQEIRTAAYFRLLLASLEIGDELRHLLVELRHLIDNLLGLSHCHAHVGWRVRFRLRLRLGVPPDRR